MIRYFCKIGYNNCMVTGLPFWILLLLILVFSLWLSLCDIKSLQLPLWGILTAGLTLLAVRIFFYKWDSLYYLLSSAILTAIYFITKIITKNKLGSGDLLFGIFQGVGFKPQYIWICLAVETVSGLIAFIIVRAGKKSLGTKKMPFIPFMASGLLVSFLVDCFAAF